jgi:uncharacterized phiE125 gp8 family phage protein
LGARDGPSIEPLTATEAKLQCRVDTTAEDALFTILIAAARSYVEEYLGRALLTQSWQLVQDDWTEEIWLPRAAPLAVGHLGEVLRRQRRAADGGDEPLQRRDRQRAGAHHTRAEPGVADAAAVALRAGHRRV